MSRNVPDDLFVRVDKLLGDEPFWKLAEIIYNRGAQDALERFQGSAIAKVAEADLAWREGNDDAFRFGKLQGYNWAESFAEHLINEYKEEE